MTLAIAFVLVLVIGICAGWVFGGTHEQFKEGGSRELASELNQAYFEIDQWRARVEHLDPVRPEEFAKIDKRYAPVISINNKADGAA
jgi:hypothetical protein